MKFPAVYKICEPMEGIIKSDKSVIGSVMDYWKWAHSNLLDNAERGTFAEYLVAKAVGDKSSYRVNWEKYDLVSSEGIRIEVKTSAYIQTWGQDKLSELKFRIGKTYGYDNEKNAYDDEKKRQADVYVFCVFKEKDQENLNLLDTTQWEFYVLASKVLNEDSYYAEKNSISLNPLMKLGAAKCNYENIHKEVIKAMNDN